MGTVLEFKKKSPEITNVVPLGEITVTCKAAGVDFSEIEAANRAKAEKLRKERAEANAKVTKSYGLKKK